MNEIVIARRAVCVEAISFSALGIAALSLVVRNDGDGSYFQSRLLEVELSKMTEQLSLLAAAGSEMAQAQNKVALLMVAAQAARQLTGAAYSSIGLVEGEMIHWQSAAGKPIEEVRGYRLPISEGLCGWVVRNGRSRRSADVTKEPDYFQQYAEMRSELDVPIKSGEKVIGVLSCESPGIKAFSAEHQALLQVLAGYVAIAAAFKRSLFR